MSFEERYVGMEFDRFALDAEGQVGLFASSGCGEVPPEVRRHWQAHDAVADQPEEPHFRSSEVWRIWLATGCLCTSSRATRISLRLH